VIDFSATAEQAAFGEAAMAAVRTSSDPGGADASSQTWQALARLGALALLTDDGGGDLPDLVALMSALGSAACPGPVVATIAAAPHLTESERRQLSAGQLRVTVAVGHQVPWLDSADVVLEVAGDDVWRVSCEKDGPILSLSGEPWTAVRTRREEKLKDGPRFVQAAELGLAAALIGMTVPLLNRGADHARTRVQFGRPIGSFQGVAHPLANAWAELTAAAELVRLVATEIALGAASTTRARMARAEAADTALRAAYGLHQAMGGLSFAVETGIGTASTRIRQWSLLLPDHWTLNDASRRT
jgi:alkylation response protein AidB-like acyl-CoA dehydrogenase